MSPSSSVVLPALLAGSAAAAWLALPPGAALRVESLLGPRAGRPPPVSTSLVRRVGARLAERLGRGRRREREQERAVEACAVLASELRAGRAPASALSAAAAVACGPTATSLRSAASVAALGGDVPAVLADAPPGAAAQGMLRGLGACWAVCAATGSGLAAAAERLGESERAAGEQRRAVQVELAGPRATARMLAVLPAVGLLMAAGLGAAPLAFLLGTPAGRVCLLLGLVLEVLGLRWTARLASGAARSG